MCKRRAVVNVRIEILLSKLIHTTGNNNYGIRECEQRNARKEFISGIEEITKRLKQITKIHRLLLGREREVLRGLRTAFH